MSRNYERVGDRYYRRYPRSLRTLAREYARVRVYRFQEWCRLQTALADMHREVIRLRGHRQRYHRHLPKRLQLDL